MKNAYSEHCIYINLIVNSIKRKILKTKNEFFVAYVLHFYGESVSFFSCGFVHHLCWVLLFLKNTKTKKVRWSSVQNCSGSFKAIRFPWALDIHASNLKE